jgi:hypothetical protein
MEMLNVPHRLRTSTSNSSGDFGHAPMIVTANAGEQSGIHQFGCLVVCNKSDGLALFDKPLGGFGK